MPRDLPTGIFKTPYGYRAIVRVRDGALKTRRYPPTASLTDMRQWREDQRATTTTAPADPVLTATGFPADVVTYLETVRAMPTYKERTKHLGEWLTILGDIPSLEIQPRQIRAARDRWLTVGPKRVLEKVQGATAQWVDKAVALSASAVNHRLRALENFFTVMYPDEPNPVRGVDEVQEPAPEPKGHTFALALEILRYMPDVTKPLKGGAVEKGSLSRVRFETMLWTGLPAVQLARLKPDMVDWITGTVLVPRRQKGKQSRRARRRVERPRPLLPQAQAALKQFFALGANTKFSSSSLGKSVKRAIRAANRVRARRRQPLIPDGLTVYTLTRHTFGTETMRASKNLKAVQELMGHADITQTERYALAAVSEATVEAIRLTGNRAGNFRRLKAGSRGASGKRPIRRNA